MTAPRRSIPRRRLPFTPLGKSLDGLTRKAFSKFGFADDHVLRRWPEIVGPDLAHLTAPERLSRPQKGARHGSTLTVRVAGAAALEMQHMAPHIIDKINGFYGRPVVGHLKLVQGPLPRKLAPPQPPNARRAGRTAAVRGLDTQPYAIDDADLAQALARLDQAVRNGQE